MSVLSCCTSRFARLSRAAAKATQAQLRNWRFGTIAPDWAERAEVCERCPVRIIHRTVSYCGKPFLDKIDRDESVEGCGCPVIGKAKDSAEHCPIDSHHRAALTVNGQCMCKWCDLRRLERSNTMSSASR